MALIYETTNFILETREKPFVAKKEGGHIRIMTKLKIADRTKLSPEQAVEYIKLSMVAGESLTNVMQRQGIDIGIVNYQEMGNWSVFKPEGNTMHLHIFGRAKTATVQKYGEAVLLPKRETGFYDNFEPLDEYDIQKMQEEIKRLLETEKYKNFKSCF
jgi:diadenosine tetraphosphate (Ap4A) HIT family hydrolase